jgi:hypothetical protein
MLADVMIATLTDRLYYDKALITVVLAAVIVIVMLLIVPVNSIGVSLPISS